MSADLSIINMSQSDKQTSPLIHKFLPNPSACFRMLVIASSGSGKSNMIKNLIMRPGFGFKQHYKQDIFIISETLGLDQTWDDVPLPKHHKMNRWSEPLVRQMMEYSKKSKRGTLWILDDLVCCNSAVNRNKTTLLDRLFMMGRHYKISLIITTQKYKQLPPTMRVNASHTIAFALSNITERKSFLSDHSHIKTIEQKYDIATAKPYHFLYINKSKMKTFRNFEEELL